jgi:hypothetical protein
MHPKKEGRFVSRSIFEKDHFKFKSVWGGQGVMAKWMA